MIDVNIKGVLYGIAAALPQMISAEVRAHHQRLVGRRPQGRPGGAVYAATKHAVRALSEGLRQEVKPHNIRTTIISPGAVAPSCRSSDHRAGRRRARAQALRRGRDPGRQLRPRRRLRDQPAGGCRHQRDPLPPHRARSSDPAPASGQRRRPRTQRPLHQHRVDPAAELEAHRLEGSDVAEARPRVHARSSRRCRCRRSPPASAAPPPRLLSATSRSSSVRPMPRPSAPGSR